MLRSAGVFGDCRRRERMQFAATLAVCDILVCNELEGA